MSMDSNPVPGLPLLTQLFCNVTKIKKKYVATCDFPDALYTKKAFYGGIPGAGLGFVEIALVAVFIILSFKMKNDITKCFLTVVYAPLGISAIFKLACAIYGILSGAYGTLYMVFLMFFNFFYITTIVVIAIGSILYLAGMIIVARKQQNFEMNSMWPSFLPTIVVGLLLSGSYTLISSVYNQLPAAALFFLYVLCTIALVFLLLVTICVVASRPSTVKTDDSNISEDPAIYDARSRLGYGAGFVVMLNIPVWFELFYKIVELFCPYLWTGTAEKTAFYSAQAIEMLTCDTIRIFMSLILLFAMFVNSSTRFALGAWKNHTASAKNQKIFTTVQKIPLLQETDPKKDAAKKPDSPTPSTTTTTTNDSAATDSTSTPATLAPPQPVTHYQTGGPMSYPPGMMPYPQHMATTIVYTPPVQMHHPAMVAAAAAAQQQAPTQPATAPSAPPAATPPGLIVKDQPK